MWVCFFKKNIKGNQKENVQIKKEKNQLCRKLNCQFDAKNIEELLAYLQNHIYLFLI